MRALQRVALGCVLVKKSRVLPAFSPSHMAEQGEHTHTLKQEEPCHASTLRTHDIIFGTAAVGPLDCPFFTPAGEIKIKQNFNEWTRRTRICDCLQGSTVDAEGIVVILSGSVWIFRQKPRQ